MGNLKKNIDVIQTEKILFTFNVRQKTPVHLIYRSLGIEKILQYTAYRRDSTPNASLP